MTSRVRGVFLVSCALPPRRVAHPVSIPPRVPPSANSADPSGGDDPPPSPPRDAVSIASSAADVAERVLSLEREADEAEAREDDETAAAVAAAGAEIDAFLAHAVPHPNDDPTDDPDDDPPSDDPTSERSAARALARRERRVAAVSARYGRAKAALGALIERLERVQLEMDALAEEDDAVTAAVVAAGGPGEPVPGAALVADPETARRVPARRRLESRAAETAAEIATRRRELARLAPEVQRAREELLDAEMDAAATAEERRRTSTERRVANAESARTSSRIAAEENAAARRYAAARREALVRASTRRAMGRERDAEIIRAASVARRAACARLREKLALASAALDEAAATEKARHADDVRRLLELKASTDAAMEYAGTYAAARRSAREARRASRRREAADLLAKGINPHETFRRRDEAARAARAERLAADAHAEREAEIRGRLRREESEFARREAEAAAARATREKHERDKSRRAEQIRAAAFMRASTREGVDVLDATGHGGVYASEVSNAKPARFGTGIAPDEEALRTSRMRFPDVEPLDALLTAREREMLAREAARRADKAETRVGVESLGASYEANWSAYAPAHGAAVDLDERGMDEDGADADADGDSNSNDARSDPDAIERRRRRDAIVAIENARLLDIAASRMADPDRLYARDPVCGLTLAGDAFASTPSRVVFRDFEVGKRYRKRVTITNVSHGTSTFRVMDFPVEHRGSLEVTYDHPGNLSAGMSSRVTVTFTPKIAQTLHTIMSLSTTAGVVEIPVECHPSRVDARVVPTDVDFGAVVVGATRRRKIHLENAGATPAAFELADPAPRGANASTRAAPSPFTVAVEGAGRLLEDGTAVPAGEGVVPGYGSVVVVATFAPAPEHGEGGFEEEMVVRWTRGDGDGDGDGAGAGSSSDGSSSTHEVVTLRGVSDPSPVHLGGRDVVDFKTCAAGCAYRDAVVVRNRGDVAARCDARAPESLAGILDVVPDYLFVQPKSEAVFSLKFRPPSADEMATRASPTHFDAATGRLAVDVRVASSRQTIPASFRVVAVVTTADLAFDPPELRFGNVCVGETSEIRLRVTNPGALMQQFGFTRLPDDVDAAPARFGEILPGETRVVRVRFAPKRVGRREFKVTVKSLLGAREFELPCAGWGVFPPLETPGGNLLTLPPTAVRESVAGSVFLRNPSDEATETFEIIVPRDARDVLVVSPHVGTLAPGETKRVRVAFCPKTHETTRRRGHLDLAEASDGGDAGDASNGGDGDAKTDEGVGEGGDSAVDSDASAASAPGSSAQAPPPRAETWRLVVHVAPRSRTGASPDADPLAKEHLSPDPDPDRSAPIASSSLESAPGGAPRRMHLEVRTATHGSAVSVENLPETPGSSALAYALDFGDVAVGARSTRPVTLRNDTDETLTVSASAPDHEGVFSALSALRPLAPRSSLEIKMEFAPAAATTYAETLTLKTSLRAIRVAMRGAGVDPRLRVEPEGIVDAGDALVGDQKHATVEVSNPSAFPVSYRVALRDVEAPGTTSRCPFTCVPAGGRLAPGESATVTVSFAPTAPGAFGLDAMFRATLAVTSEGTGAVTTRRVIARCWSEGGFVAGADDVRDAPPDATGARGVAATAAFLPRVDVLRAPAVRPDRERVAFTAPTAIRPGESTTTTIRVGSVAESGGGGAPVEFAFEPLDEDATRRGWRVEPAQGIVQPGEIENVVVTFEPPEEVSAGDLAYHGLAEWVETTTTCRLRGGDPAPSEEDGREIVARLRCRLLPPKTEAEKAADAEREAAERAARGDVEEDPGEREGGEGEGEGGEGDEGRAEEGEEADDA